MILKDSHYLQNQMKADVPLLEQGYFCLFALKRALLQAEIDSLFSSLTHIVSNLSRHDLIWLLKKLIDLNIDKKQVIEVFTKNSSDEIESIIVSEYQHFTDLELISFCDKKNEIKLYRSIATRHFLSEFLIDYLLSKNDKETMQLLLDNPHIKLSHDIIKEIAEHIPSAESLISKLLDSDIKVKDEKKSAKVVYFFVNPNKSSTSFLYRYEQNEISKVKRLLNNLSQEKKLSEFFVVSCLGKGDVFGFIFGISILAEIPFKMADDICTNYFTKPEFVELLESINFSNSNIEACTIILKLIAKATIEHSIDSTNFKSLISHQLEFETNLPQNLQHIVQYLINLGQS